MPTFVSSDLNYCRHVHVQSEFYLVWMLLVVNIVICPTVLIAVGLHPWLVYIDNRGRFALTATVCE